MPILWWNQLDFGWRHLPDCSTSRREWPKNYRLEMPIIFFFFYITLSNGQQLKKWLWYIAAHRVQVANTIYNSIYSDCIPLIDVVYLGFFFLRKETKYQSNKHTAATLNQANPSSYQQNTTHHHHHEYTTFYLHNAISSHLMILSPTIASHMAMVGDRAWVTREGKHLISE